MCDDNLLDRVMFYVLFFTSFILFMFIGCTVHAEEVNITSSIYGDTGYSNMYWGQNWYNGSLSNSNFSFGTRYSGRLRDFVFDVRRSFVANTIYTVYVYAPTNDFRNTLDEVIIDDITNETSCTVINYQFVSKTKLSASFVCGYNSSRLQMSWYGPEQGYLTGDTNFNINKVTLETQSSSGANNDDIINNANENTQDIINNNNSNTQDVIDNQNQNTQDIIDSQQQIDDSLNTYCKKGPTDFDINNYNFVNGYINSTGGVTNDNQYKSSPYFVIKGGETYTIKLSINRTLPYICWYYANKNMASCVSQNNQNTFTLTAPLNAKYLRVTVGNSSGNFVVANITGPICNNWDLEKQNEINGAINNLNDVINDSNVDSDLIDSVLDVSFYDNNDLTSIITAPLTILHSLLNDNTCQPLELPFHLDIGDYDNSTNAYLPCGSILWERAPSSIVAAYRLIVCAFIFFRIGVALWRTVDNVIDPFKDHVEVLDL